ncbi:hypothetical protein ACIA5C_47125 [Actinoplanes sp. NPDC051343]|uniref:hypothetical protein n=1 Tax=Actinoplanes sp. NPDC051343 TaxID=3363906 RepID=UPI00378849CD
MARKPLTLRTAVITTAATAAGSTAGALAATIATHLDFHQPGVSQLATALTALWVLEKLHTLIDSDDPTKPN